MLPIDRFSDSSQDVARRAYEICQRYGHDKVDTEHILLALLERPEGLSLEMTGQASFDQALIKQRLDDELRARPKAAGVVQPSDGRVFISPRVKDSLEWANAEAIRQKDDLISTRHIFQGILAERDTPVARILAEARRNPG